jgi:hypothetical protein
VSICSLCSEYLASRGITDETIKTHGLELTELCAFPPETVKERLGRKLPKDVNEVIWVPVPDANGNIVSWIARPLPTIADGPKFICPVGSDGPPYIPRDTYKLKNGKPIVLTEGAIKVFACLQAGVDAIGLNGVWGAGIEDSNEYVVIRGDLQEALDWRGRKVCLAFDADWAVNPKVRQALFRLFFIMSASGADVFQLCTWALDQGKGIDDYWSFQNLGDVTAFKK